MIAPRGYHHLVELAKQLGRPLCRLIALSDDNDPFMTGRPGARAERAAWFAELWQRLDIRRGVHLRRIHYLLVSTPGSVLPNGKPYENTLGAWKFLGHAAADARFQNLVDPGAFTDRRADLAFEYHPTEGAPAGHVFAGYSPTHAPHYSADFDVRCEVECSSDLEGHLGYFSAPWFWVSPPNYGDHHAIELWIEKSTVTDVLLPIAERRGVSLVVGQGEISLTQCHATVRRVLAHRRPTRILYVSDFDPAGQNMPVSVARKIEWLIQQSAENLDMQVIPIALTGEQVRQYGLPRVPIKDSDKNKAAFEGQNGEGAVELDALEATHPGELANIVNAAIDRFEDPTLDRRIADAERAVRQRLNGIKEQVCAEHADELAEIQIAFDEMKLDVQGHADAIAEHRETFLQAVEELKAEFEAAVVEHKAVFEAASGEHQGAIDAAVAEWRERADPAIEAIRREMQAAAPNATEIEWPKPEVEGISDPLFDSTRDYLDQIDRYHRHQGRTNGGAR